MSKLEILPDDTNIDISSDETILTASLRNSIPHLNACGGIGKCSTCRISIVSGIENCLSPNEIEKQLADKIGLPSDIRLACQTKVTGDVKVRRLLLDDRDMQITNQLGIEKTGPVGTSRKLAIMFSDIRGFTPLTESLSAYDIMFILNRYFDIMGEVIIRNGGQINNYIGDAIFALFGLDDSGDHTFLSVKAGVEMLEAMDNFKPYLEKAYGRVFDIGIGIHHGEVIVGMVGSDNNRRVNVIGDTVNTASRVEAANKEAETRLLISEDAHQLIKDRVEVDDFVRLKLKGTSQRMTLYEISAVIGKTTAIESDTSRVFFGRDWQKTLPITDLHAGEKKKFVTDSKNILLVNHDQQIYAMENACPHMHLPLDMGQISDAATILCPFHDSEFCLKTGEVKRWCENTSSVPEDFAPLIKGVKTAPINILPVHTEDGYIWVATDD